MTSETFVDTSGFYALLAAKDDRHDAARTFMRRAADECLPLLTTDYVLDETATLLVARSLQHLIKPFFDHVLESQACRVEWTDSKRFLATVQFRTKHQEKGWSFTDCLSFVVMQKLDLQQALTKDHHFRQAGFTALLAD